MTIDELASLVSSVATKLGPGWTIERTEWHTVYLIGPEGERLHVKSDRYGKSGKLEISGNYPANEAYDVKNFSINVGETRGAATITKEIERRLLPDYATELRRIELDNVERARNRGKRTELAQELADMLGAEVSDDDRAVSTEIRKYPVTIKIDYRAESGSITFNRATPDQLRAIVAIIAAGKEAN